ncbi:hypothetical protein OZX65_03555 [Leuconostocaceae bacterium ESL0723]|nr:hypothetical protein OZX65_03555 [Leuconostocaceae bacterium ESL0723]
MDTDSLVRELVRIIQPLFKREYNTVYEVQIIQQNYSGRTNIFFEWHRLGRATVSREIKSLAAADTQDLLTVVKKLGQVTQLPVHLN